MLCIFAFLHLFWVINAQWNNDDDLCRTPDRDSGTCVPIYSCRPMLDALERVPQPIPQDIQAYLQSYRCGFAGPTPQVCCPARPISFANDQDNSLSAESGFPDVSRHRNIELLPRNCGNADESNKIVNGNKTSLFEFPWMALLSYRTRFGQQFKCGGTIINRRYILTAAHCLENFRTTLVGVRVGEHDTRTATDCETVGQWGEEVCAPPYQDLSVERIITHPSFNPKMLSNDIGLVRVSPINLALENSKPICLPLAEARNYNLTNRNAYVTGWGITETGRPSSELLKVSLPIVPLEECSQLYRNVATLTDNQLCAGGRSNADSCGGDSGGPLQVSGRLFGDIRYVQQGIVSFGPRNCGYEPLPGVYTRVASYMDWVLDNIEP